YRQTHQLQLLILALHDDLPICYFLEDATEINNILDHNLAALVLPAVTQKDQVIPFDLNRGAGFWWANCQNQFTRNVAADCAEYRSEEHTSELQSRENLVCRLLL